jgi:starvation-inducible DNA-binding protein
MELVKLLSSEFALQQKTQLFHWNVRGPNFMSLHGLFGEQYAKLVKIVDGMAELIRQGGDLAPTVSEMLEESAIETESTASSWEEKVSELLSSHRSVISALDEAIPKELDEAVKNFYIDTLGFHKKQAWFLEMHLPNEQE